MRAISVIVAHMLSPCTSATSANLVASSSDSCASTTRCARSSGFCRSSGKAVSPVHSHALLKRSRGRHAAVENATAASAASAPSAPVLDIINAPIHEPADFGYRTSMPSRPEPILGGPASVVETACPLDCPDACSLAVTVRHGKIVQIDGSNRNPVTEGYICAKVRKFGERVYGPDRILYPAVRKGRKGTGQFKRVPWDEALELVVRKFREAKQRSGGDSILPFSYGGSNGLLTQDNLDAQLWRRFGTCRLERTVCAAPTGAANMALYGKMVSTTYQDYPEAKLIILWGV